MRLLRGKALVAAAAVVAVIGVAGAGLTVASQAVSAAAAGPAPSASASAAAAGCQVLAAEVSRTGAVAGSTCPGIKSTLIGAGGYDVTFPGPARDCVAVASLRFDGLPAGTAPGEIAADPVPGEPLMFRVRTFDHGGVAASRAFHITLQCAPLPDAGTVKIRYPDTSARLPVACGMSRDAVVLATAQAGAGPVVSWAAPDPGRCQVRIHLSGAPRPGHPVPVGWELLR